MSGKKTTGGLTAKLGARLAKAHEDHKADETQWGNAELPAGIERGVAQLKEVKFDTFKNGDMTGQYYFMAYGIVKMPTEVNGLPVEGLRTQIGPEPLCDTPTRSRKTLEDHVGWVYNELRKLGVDTSKIDHTQLEDVAQALTEARPHFAFRTWKGKKQTTGPYAGQEPRTQHDWLGAVDYNDDHDPAAGVDDHTPPAPGKPLTAKPADPDPADLDSGDIESLARKAEGGDEKAADLLTEMAVKAGYSEEDVLATKTWDEVVEMIKGNGPGEEEGDAVHVPKLNDIFDYYPTDPKTKKKAAKPVEVEIFSVDEKAGTVVCRKKIDKKVVYKDVPFSELHGD